MRASQRPVNHERRATSNSARDSNARSTGARKSKRIPKQGELPFRTWGGARPGAGRKPKGERAMVSHHARPAHKERFPVLVTTRVRSGLQSLRRPAEAAVIRGALASSRIERESEADGRAQFHVVHHSIQSNHLHLIVEASDRRALSGGMRGLLVRIARALNRLWRRRGSVFADRFHERELPNPRQVRNALVYVLQNSRKHNIQMCGPDPFSSGPEFDGWSPCAAGAGSAGSIRLRRAGRVEIPSPKTWLLGVGWQRHGLIDPREAPRAG